ncbi:MAG: Ubiquinone/menaquinone biosynthesis C-methyltransferase UbiE [Verrucomicrobiota bacterium]|jgi:demethylmenaquinone methyltransferase/2-methoxy-6-polyprenyl-1,4-benzoquinol methylase
MPDPKAVNSMFGRIAKRYDTANRVLSAGIDRGWRRRLVEAVGRHRPARVLDLATGSGDVAFAIARGLHPSPEIIGMDFCQPMLDEAEAKRRMSRDPEESKIRFLPGDGLDLPLPDGSQDAVTIAFGLRNLADRARGLAEMRRVLKPGGMLHVLEFSQPHAWFRPFYYFYLRHLLPALARLLTGDRDAYLYLGDTIGKFPSREELTAEISTAGLEVIAAVPLTLGIVALHSARKPAAG